MANRSGAGRNGLSKAFGRIMEGAGIVGKVLRVRGAKGSTVKSLSFHSFKNGVVIGCFTDVMPRANRLDRFTFDFLQNADFCSLLPTSLHFVLPFFFAQNSTFVMSGFSGSGQPRSGIQAKRVSARFFNYVS
jgi:hypothetical protein